VSTFLFFNLLIFAVLGPNPGHSMQEFYSELQPQLRVSSMAAAVITVITVIIAAYQLHLDV
jgi:hypothetical protein